jgi:hypothetical protein
MILQFHSLVILREGCDWAQVEGEVRRLHAVVAVFDAFWQGDRRKRDVIGPEEIERILGKIYFFSV